MPRITRVTVILAAAVLSACSSVHLYDPGRDSAAKKAVEQKDASGLDTVAETSAETLDKLLQSELALVAESHDFLYQLDIFEIASGNDDDASLLHSIKKIDDRLTALGYTNRKNVLEERDSLRDYEAAFEKMVMAESTIVALTRGEKVVLPACSISLPTRWPDIAVPAGTVEADILDETRTEYGIYRSECLSILALAANSRGVVALRAHIDFDEHERQKQKSAAKKRGAEIKRLKKEIASANASGDTPSSALTELKEHIEKLRRQQNAFDIEVLSDESLTSLETVLAYVSGAEEGDKLDIDGDLLAAAEMLREATSLADSAAAVIEKSKQPPVAHLVLELNRQLLLKDFAARLIQLDERERDYRLQQAEAKSEQAAAYRDFVNSLCQFGFQEPKQCDSLVYDAKNGSCEIPGTGQSCELEITWQKALGKGRKPNRFLLSAIVALTKSHREAKRESELEYRINDIAHRRALLETESAIAQWDNLLDVPADQVAAFYAAGVKPETLGDFLVKALALAGIVVIAED